MILINLLIMKTPAFDLLRVLITVAESRNFQEAADTLQISQPGVSLKLKELELLQPLPLFSYEGRRKVLTHYGRSLYELAKDGATTLERRIENLHRVYSSADLLTVRIGGRNEVLEHISPYLDFEGKIEYVGVSSKEAIDRLLRHEVDIAITYIKPDSTELQAKRLFGSKTHFCVHEKFLNGKKLSLNLMENQEFLLKTPCISYLRDGHLISDWVRHAKLNFTDLNVKHVAEDWRTIKHLVEQGAGYAILPTYINLNGPQVHCLEVPEKILSRLDFFAIFESGLKKIEAFRKLLSFSKLAT